MQKSIISPNRKSGGLVFLSGVTGEPGDARTQIINVFEKIKKRLDEAGTSMEKVLSVVVYMADLNDRPTILNPLWEKYFPDNPPARTTVEVGLGTGILVEMQVVAELASA